MKLSSALLVLSLAANTTAQADPSLGVGFSFVFSNGSRPETGVGFRLFSDSTKGKTVASIGLDYIVTNPRLRPTIGVAYLGSQSYGGLDIGYNRGSRSFDYSIGGGYIGTTLTSESSVLFLLPSASQTLNRDPERSMY